ncbi:hypothetical protein Ancab_001995 [Ancistrocladus abbreviatus]
MILTPMLEAMRAHSLSVTPPLSLFTLCLLFQAYVNSGSSRNRRGHEDAASCLLPTASITTSIHTHYFLSLLTYFSISTANFVYMPIIPDSAHTGVGFLFFGFCLTSSADFRNYQGYAITAFRG